MAHFLVSIHAGVDDLFWIASPTCTPNYRNNTDQKKLIYDCQAWGGGMIGFANRDPTPTLSCQVEHHSAVMLHRSHLVYILQPDLPHNNQGRERMETVSMCCE